SRAGTQDTTTLPSRIVFIHQFANARDHCYLPVTMANVRQLRHEPNGCPETPKSVLAPPCTTAKEVMQQRSCNAQPAALLRDRPDEPRAFAEAGMAGSESSATDPQT